MALSFLRRWLNRPNLRSGKVTPHGEDLIGGEEQFQTGLKFADGEGGVQDYAQAAHWYAQAAAQNHGLAQYHLAMLYAHGHGVRRDRAISLQWLSRAAKHGLALAQCRLGAEQHFACRAAGTSATSDARIEALKWLKLSAAQGSRVALNVSESVALGMTLEEVAESSRRAGRFVAG